MVPVRGVLYSELSIFRGRQWRRNFGDFRMMVWSFAVLFLSLGGSGTWLTAVILETGPGMFLDKEALALVPSGAVRNFP